MTVEYYQGLCCSQWRTGDLDVRRENLKCARDLLQRFLERLRSYKLLDDECLRLLTPSHRWASTRDAKIARMRAKVSYERQLQDPMPQEEELQRKRHICLVRALAIDAQMEIEAISSEIELLCRNAESGATRPDLEEFSTAAPRAEITRPFVLLGNRQKLALQVFRPGHNLPTMTIDEYLELERRRGGILSGKSPPKDGSFDQETDGDCDKVADTQTLKDRRFDAFKDENPRGWGNTYNLS